MDHNARRKVLTAQALSEQFGCHLWRPPAQEVSLVGVQTLEEAHGNHVSFFTNTAYLQKLAQSQAAVILCHPDPGPLVAEHNNKAAIAVAPNPYAVAARVGQFYFEPKHSFEGVSAQAYVDASAHIGVGVVVFPHVYIGPGARIGDRSVLYPGAFVGAGAQLGEDVVLYPNAVVREGCVLGARCLLNPGAVVGGEGFGFARDGQDIVKIPQQGTVRLGADVEVGSNACIDRATFGETRVEDATKIDSLVQIGHNVVIGKGCFLAGQSGVAGSSTLGNGVTLAGQVGISGHISLGDGVIMLGQSGASKNISQPGVYNGSPARPNSQYLREQAVLIRLAKAKPQKVRE